MLASLIASLRSPARPSNAVRRAQERGDRLCARGACLFLVGVGLPGRRRLCRCARASSAAIDGGDRLRRRLHPGRDPHPGRPLDRRVDARASAAAGAAFDLATIAGVAAVSVLPLLMKSGGLGLLAPLVALAAYAIYRENRKDHGAATTARPATGKRRGADSPLRGRRSRPAIDSRHAARNPASAS